jgi:hypothetical protein
VSADNAAKSLLKLAAMAVRLTSKIAGGAGAAWSLASSVSSFHLRQLAEVVDEHADGARLLLVIGGARVGVSGFFEVALHAALQLLELQ